MLHLPLLKVTERAAFNFSVIIAVPVSLNQTYVMNLIYRVRET